VALGGLSCAVPLGFDDGCRGVGSLRVAFRPHPDAGGIVWSLPRTSVRLQSIIGNWIQIQVGIPPPGENLKKIKSWVLAK
jgi:hypothetical protein